MRKKAKKSRETLCFSNVLRFRMVWVRKPFGGIPPKSARSCGVSFEVNMNVRRKLKSQTFQHMDRRSNSGENNEEEQERRSKCAREKAEKSQKLRASNL